jgi:hypothetical protein
MISHLLLQSFQISFLSVNNNFLCQEERPKLKSTSLCICYGIHCSFICLGKEEEECNKRRVEKSCLRSRMTVGRKTFVVGVIFHPKSLSSPRSLVEIDERDGHSPLLGESCFLGRKFFSGILRSLSVTQVKDVKL